MTEILKLLKMSSHLYFSSLQDDLLPTEYASCVHNKITGLCVCVQSLPLVGICLDDAAAD